jgi:hypothetical protein
MAARGADKVAEADRPSRPSDPDTRRTVLGMPAAVVDTAAPAAPADDGKPAKGGRRDAGGGRKGRRGVVIMPIEHGGEDTQKLLEDLDAGFESIVRPSDVPVVPIAPSAVPEPPAAVEVAPAPVDPAPVVEAAPAQAEPAAEPAPAATPAPAVEAGSEGWGDAPVVEVAPASSSADETARRAQHDADMAEVRALFNEMAVAHARPLRDFMIEVSWGDPTKEWLDVAVPATSGLRGAAHALEMPELGVALEGFAAALELCAGESTLNKDAKELLLGAWQKLIEILPAAFALEGERGRREPIIVRSLLFQVPGARKVALDKIYAAGLVSLEMLYAAGPRELAETTGIDPDLAARIHERFQRYRREVAELDPGKDRAKERAELEELAAELAQHHDAHEKAAAAWSGDAAARRVEARKARADTLLKINVALARMGEVDRLKALEKLPFGQKIRELRRYLEEAKRKASRG